MLLPHLPSEPGVELAQVATRRSLSAVNAQRKFGFQNAGTDSDAVFEDPTVDAVFIVTRHSAHAAMTCRALEAGKAVFVEKPLALTLDELDRILATVDATGNDRIMVGFNRRFAPLLVEMRQRFGRTTEPTNARYLVNAGRLGSDSWYRDTELEGTRFVGEGGHFIDTMSWWIGSDPVEVTALAAGGPDEVQVSLRYGDGSLATVTYLSNVHRRFPKETFEVSSGGRTARLDNFRRTTVWSGPRARVRRHYGSPDKGQSAQVKAFVDAVRTGSSMPISLDSLAATTRATLATASAASSGTTQSL
jgi:predicted dehydrogenase